LGEAPNLHLLYLLLYEFVLIAIPGMTRDFLFALTRQSDYYPFWPCPQNGGKSAIHVRGRSIDQHHYSGPSLQTKVLLSRETVLWERMLNNSIQAISWPGHRIEDVAVNAVPLTVQDGKHGGVCIL
jgi:hypothetical protein